MINHDEQKPLIIKSTKGISSLNIKEIWAFRNLIYMMLMRDLKTRYKQTAFGPIWIILTPLVNTIAYTLVFSVIANMRTGGVNAILFMYVGIMVWDLFTRSVTGAMGSMRSEIGLMAKVYFPRLITVIVYTISGFFDFLVTFLTMFIFFAFFKVAPSFNIIYIPFFIFITIFSGVSIGIWFAGPNVKYRDVSRALPMVLSFLKFLSPVVFMAEYLLHAIPAKWHYIYYLNPFSFFVDGFRWSLLGTPFLANYGWGVVGSYAVIVLLFIGGLYYFKRWERTIVDIQ